MYPKVVGMCRSCSMNVHACDINGYKTYQKSHMKHGELFFVMSCH